MDEQRGCFALLMIPQWSFENFELIWRPIYAVTKAPRLIVDVPAVPDGILRAQYEHHQSQPFFNDFIRAHQGRPAKVTVFELNSPDYAPLIKLKTSLSRQFTPDIEPSFIPENAHPMLRIEALHLSDSYHGGNKDITAWSPVLINSNRTEYFKVAEEAGLHPTSTRALFP